MPRYRCAKCHTEFDNEMDLGIHLTSLNACPVSPIPAIIIVINCDLCGKRFFNTTKAALHMIECEQEYLRMHAPTKIVI